MRSVLESCKSFTFEHNMIGALFIFKVNGGVKVGKKWYLKVGGVKLNDTPGPRTI